MYSFWSGSIRVALTCGSGVEVYVFNITLFFLYNGMKASQSKDLSCAVISLNTTLH